MAKKTPQTLKTEKAAEALAKGFQKLLEKNGFKHALTNFSITSKPDGSDEDVIINCPPNYSKKWVCRTINNVTTCRYECVKN